METSGVFSTARAEYPVEMANPPPKKGGEGVYPEERSSEVSTPKKVSRIKRKDLIPTVGSWDESFCSAV